MAELPLASFDETPIQKTKEEQTSKPVKSSSNVTLFMGIAIIIIVVMLILLSFFFMSDMEKLKIRMDAIGNNQSVLYNHVTRKPKREPFVEKEDSTVVIEEDTSSLSDDKKDDKKEDKKDDKKEDKKEAEQEAKKDDK